MTFARHEYVSIVADDVGTDYLMVMIWGEPGDLVCTLAVDEDRKRIVVRWPESVERPKHPSDYDKLVRLLAQGAEILKGTYSFLNTH